jgi:hypothetical protein
MLAGLKEFYSCPSQSRKRSAIASGLGSCQFQAKSPTTDWRFGLSTHASHGLELSIANPPFYLMEEPSVFLEVHVTHTRLLTLDVGLISQLDDMVAQIGNRAVTGCVGMIDTRILTVF